MAKRTKVVVGATGTKVVEFSAAEEAARDSEKADWDAGAAARTAEEIQRNRRQAYQAEADSLYFEEQAGEVAAGTWAAKRSEIKERFPK